MKNGEFNTLCNALEYIKDETKAHVVLQSESDAHAITLWIASSYLLDHWNLFPKLLINSPERACGKTTALQVIEAFVPNGRIASSITAAAVYRFIESCSPTLLIDEADRSLKSNEELNAIINAGHTRRTATKMLSTKNSDGNWEFSELSLWCPQVIAGIGEFEDTLMSRSIVINLRRKLPTEQTRRLYVDHFDDQLALRTYLSIWSESAQPQQTSITFQHSITDRARDNWEPLLWTAELAGGEWPSRAHAALKAIEVDRWQDKKQSSGSELLTDIRELLHGETGPEVRSEKLLKSILMHADSDWNTINHGRPITSKWLAQKLKLYGIRPQRRSAYNVYMMHDFNEAFERYLGTV